MNDSEAKRSKGESGWTERSMDAQGHDENGGIETRWMDTMDSLRTHGEDEIRGGQDRGYIVDTHGHTGLGCRMRTRPSIKQAPDQEIMQAEN